MKTASKKLRLAFLHARVKNCEKLSILERIRQSGDNEEGSESSETDAVNSGGDGRVSGYSDSTDPDGSDTGADRDERDSDSGDSNGSDDGGDDDDSGDYHSDEGNDPIEDADFADSDNDPGDDSDPSSNHSSIDSSVEDEDSAVTDSSLQANEALIDDNVDRNAYVLRFIRKWAMWGVTGKRVDCLLRGLKCIYPVLPQTYRTLLSTPHRTDIQPMGEGSFWYKGIKTNLLQRLNITYLTSNNNRIVIDVGCDGVKLFRAAYTYFWVIMGCLVDSDNEPFIIAIYRGEGKPPPLVNI